MSKGHGFYAQTNNLSTKDFLETIAIPTIWSAAHDKVGECDSQIAGMFSVLTDVLMKMQNQILHYCNWIFQCCMVANNMELFL